MTGMLFGVIVLSIILVSAAGWLLAGNVAATVVARLGSHRSRAAFAGAGAAVIAMAGAATWWYADGSKKSAAMSLDVPMPAPVSTTGAVIVPKEGGDLTVLVDRLAARLAREPEDAQGWALFARTQMELQRYSGATAAYAKAVTLFPADADLQAERADAEFMANNRKWTKSASAALATALKLRPEHLEALWLSGSERFDNKDYANAVKHWEKLARLAPADSEYAKEMKTALLEARALRDGKDPAAALATMTPAGTLPGMNPAPAADARTQLVAELRAATGTATVAPATVTGGLSIRGEIHVDAALQGRISPDDTVFVFAREAGASPSTMPLAARRYRAAELPIRFELSDNNAMSSAPMLSAAKALIVTARVSKTGSAGGQPGDLESSSGTVVPGAASVSITLRNVR